MAPSPSYLPTALPKSVHSRATHDGEGVVATANPQMLKWLNASVNRKFPTTNYPPPSTSLHFYTAKAISHDGEGAVATYGRSQQVRPSRVDLRSQWTATLPWRWRPRHRICQPPSRNQSIPAQRTTTGAPSLRHYPLPNYQLNRKIVNSQLPNYPLSTTNYHLHLYTSTRPFFKSLNAPITKCNRKSEIAYCVRIGECGIIRTRFCN